MFNAVIPAAIFLCACARCLADLQPVPPADPAPPTAQPETDTQPAAAPLDPAEVFDDVVAAYTFGTFAERMAITVTTADGRTRESTVTWRFHREPSTDDAVLSIELGRLTIAASGGVLRAASSLNTSAYWEHPVTGRLSPATLDELLPPLPIPQLFWALSPDASTPFPLIGEITWASAERAPAGRITCRGATAHGDVLLECDAQTNRLLRFEAPVHAAPSPRVTIACEPVDAGDPAAWMPSTEGRSPVPSLSDLRAKAGEIPVGSRIPALGLMSNDLTLWPMQDALAGAADPHGTGEPLPVAAVLVLYRPMLEASVADAKAASDAIAALSKANDRARALGEANPGRFLFRPVGVLEVGEITPDQTEKLSRAWTDSVPPVWTSSGRDMLERFAPGATTVAIVIDAQQRLTAVVPLDGRAAEAATADVAAALARAWGP